MSNQYNKISTQEFKEKAEALFPEYSYEKCEYISSRKSMIITCKVHGDFEQSSELLFSNIKFSTKLSSTVSGCNECKRIDYIKNLLTKINKKYNFDYIYPEKLNVLRTDNFIATCKVHGEFKTSLKKLSNGIQCKLCAIKKLADNQRDDLKSFIEKSKNIHGDKYDYSNVEYCDSQKHINIICKFHGEFYKKPYHHIGGQGCPICGKEKSNYERYNNKKTTLYYIFLPEYNLYKIGLTMSNVESRFKGDIKAGLKIEIIQTKEFQDGYDAYILEQKILKHFSKHKYQGKKVIGSGNTELFTENVLLYE